MDAQELHHRFQYHPPSNDKVVQHHARWRDVFDSVALDVNDAIPDGREKSLAITHLEEALFWVNAAIARGQIEYAGTP